MQVKEPSQQMGNNAPQGDSMVRNEDQIKTSRNRVEEVRHN